MNKTKSGIIASIFLNSSSFQGLIADSRIKLGIPKGGFMDEKTEEVWTKRLSPSKINIVNRLVRDIKNKYPLAGKVVDKSSFFIFLFRYLVRNNKDIFDNIDISGCELKAVFRDNKENIKKELKDGIYLKIGTYTPYSDLIKFLKKEWCFIELMRDEFKKENGLPRKEKRVRAKPKDYRDRVILAFSAYSKEELREISGLKGIASNYKDRNIAKIMRDIRWKEVSADIVRKVISNQKGSIK